MIGASFKLNRIALAGTIGVSVAIAISSFSVVRAQRFAPLGSVKYSCKGAKGSACVTGNSTGQSWGVLGASAQNHGILGESAGLGKAGVAGYSLATGPGGFGVYAESADTTGKYAALDAQGDNTNTSLFYAYNHANNTSCIVDPKANLICSGTMTGGQSSASNAGLIGNSGGNYGVYGSSATSDGVHGVTSYTNSSASGVSGIGTGAAFGVYGTSSSGLGVYGKSSLGVGVEGDSSDNIGVFGSTLGNTLGMYGVTQASSYAGIAGAGPNYGVSAYSKTGTAGAAALFANAEQNAGYIFEALGGRLGSEYGYCVIDPSGNLRCSGTITGGATVQTRHRTSSGQHILAYGSETTSATIEDFGTARLAGGNAVVQLDAKFASTIDRSRPYYVFLTPLGDTRGLYVSAKEPSGFEVREVQGGHSQIAFDYRIVAHPLDAKSDRLPLAPAVPLRAPPLPKIPRR